MLFLSRTEVGYGFDSTRTATAIRRLRMLDPSYFKEVEEGLAKIIQKMKEDYSLFKSSSAYLDNCKDTYWIRYFRGMEEAILQLDLSMTEEILPPEGIKEALARIYPLIMGSSVINPLLANIQSPEERLSIQALQIGKEIQYIFCNAEDQEQVTAYFERASLRGHIQVLPMEDLQAAICLNRILSPYFCDIASRKKLASIIAQPDPDSASG